MPVTQTQETAHEALLGGNGDGGYWLLPVAPERALPISSQAMIWDFVLIHLDAPIVP